MSTQTVVKSRASNGVATDKSTKVTFVLPAPLAQDLREAVAKGAAPSQNALVREALRREMKRLRKAEIAAAMQEAANDPLFMQDLHDCMRDFAEIDYESLQIVDEQEQSNEAQL